MLVGMAPMSNPIRSIRVSRRLWDEAKTIAVARGETISEVVRRALSDYIERHYQGPSQ